MTLETFVSVYGYPALFAGTLMEGETVLIIAGLLAHSGHLRLPWVMLVAFAGAFTADQLFFQIGRRKGKAFLERRPGWEPRIDRIRRFLVGYQVLAILGYRFLYGLRTITPVVIGASGFPTHRFVALNLCSTLLWSVVVSSAGYYFGHLVEAFLRNARHYEMIVILGATAIGGAIWFYRYRIRKG